MTHAAMWLKDAWNRVTEDTIKNRWSYAEFTRSVDPSSTPSNELLVETESLAVLLEQVNIPVDGFRSEEGDMPVAEGDGGEWEDEAQRGVAAYPRFYRL
jgi:hypothetical protein